MIQDGRGLIFGRSERCIATQPSDMANALASFVNVEETKQENGR